MNSRELLFAIFQSGITNATYIEQKQIVLSAEFRKICETNQCGGYGRCWMCPPYIGEIETLMDVVHGYPEAILYQTIHKIEDSFDIEGMFAAVRLHAKKSAQIDTLLRQQKHFEYLHLSCGGCHYCEKCAKITGEPCRFPEKALPSLEGYGVDVYNTTKNTPLKYINGQNTVTYFGMVLFKEQRECQV